MRLGIDIDECIYPFVRAWRAYAGVYERDAEDWNFFRLDGYSTEEYLQVYERGVNNRVILAYGHPIPDSVEVLTRLKEKGHTIHLATDRFVGDYAQYNTAFWLRQNFIPYDSLTFTKDKTILNVDIFLDDKPDNVRALLNSGTRAYLLDRGRKDQEPYGRIIWPQFERIVDKLAYLRGEHETSS